MDIKNKSRQSRGFYGMTAATIFCIIFSGIYNQLGHGVSSPYMNYMFLFPFVLGTGFYGILSLIPTKINLPGFSFNTYNSGVATLTIWSMLKGIFEIAGTSSPYTAVYEVSGSMMLITGVITYLIFLSNRNSKRHI
ncbi:hypothetical protein [Aminipila terrae]|uniref:Uncharacterized protein n=1 Tax=Aminipila terrae TaxID=2697030 RepID=A0A6P1MMA1_9FIRM|nr:hypothetical protein [Aminipila terrae]QHI72776.1 hypothetical protein Ami3637_10485 [Aminipila terrae]